MINSIIGAGIFGIPSKIFSLTSIYSVFAILFCAIITLVFILIFAEVATQFDRSGGPYLYTYEAFGKFPGFIIGWLALISRMAAFAAVINLLVDYLSYLNPRFTEFSTRTITILLICFFLFIINSRSVKSSSSLNNILAIFKLLPLIAFVIIGFFFINADNLELPKVLPPTASFASSIVILIFAFTGWEAVLINTGEMSNPAKNIPFAMIISTLFVAVFYILIQIVSIGTFPGLATSIRPIADAADAFMGSTGGTVIMVGAVVSTLGNLNANLLAGSRLPFSFSEEKQFPKIFSQVNEKTGVPLVSLIAYSVVTLIVSVTGTFTYAISINVIAKVITFILVAFALMKFRKSGNKIVFKLPYGRQFAIAGIIIGVGLIFSSNFSSVIDVLITIAVGLIIYFLFRPKSA